MHQHSEFGLPGERAHKLHALCQLYFKHIIIDLTRSFLNHIHYLNIKQLPSLYSNQRERIRLHYFKSLWNQSNVHFNLISVIKTIFNLENPWLLHPQEQCLFFHLSLQKENFTNINVAKVYEIEKSDGKCSFLAIMYKQGSKVSKLVCGTKQFWDF